MKFCGHDVLIQSDLSSLSALTLITKARNATFANLDTICSLLCDPITKAHLKLQDKMLVNDHGTIYPIVEGIPMLFPCDIESVRKILQTEGLQAFRQLNPVEQYCTFAILKASGENNLDYSNIWYERHLYRATQMLKDATGRFLDVGCDNIYISRGMLAADVDYVGLEPSQGPSPEFRISGLGEFLPFADASFDSVSFQTSLDHVFDYQLALAEAHRVLKPKGRLYISTLLWLEDAQIYTDTVHFHHFRSAGLEAALQGFQVDKVNCYVWKDNKHRFSAYLSGVKINGQ